MKLHERLPDTLTVDGRAYRLDLDFRNVFRMLDVLGREDLLPGARDYLALKCVMRRVPRDTAAAMRALKELLFPEPERKSKGSASPKITNYEQDADMIRAAFMQAYGINLWRDKLHWFEFTGLLANLPEGSRYTDVLSIRARPMPEPTAYNTKERQWLMEAKRRFALHLSEDEETKALENSMRAATASLLALAKKGGGESGEGH